MVRCVVKTRRMIFVVKNYQVNVPIFFRVQLVASQLTLSPLFAVCGDVLVGHGTELTV